ncbi:MAG: response regulator [Armatimonadota bacterium]
MGIKIIADEPLQSALITSQGGEEFDGSWLQPGDVLLVYAHAYAGLTGRRSYNGGLQAADRVLADPDSLLSGVAIISFQPRRGTLTAPFVQAGWGVLQAEELIPFRQLPAQPAELLSLVEQARGSHLQEWKWWLLRLEASGRLLQVTNAHYRHDYRNLIAAVRIYLGALQAGGAPVWKAREVLEALSRKEAEIPGARSPQVDVEAMVAACAKHRRLVARLSELAPPDPAAEAAPWRSWLERYHLQRATPEPPLAGRRLLMLDDQYERAGWIYVLDSLAGDDGSVEYTDSWDGAKKQLDGDPGKFDHLLLDCNLSEHVEVDLPTGLELLRPLRAYTQDLPIAMMTAYDNAELALWALRAGANDFFAKALDDNADRDSLDYYLRFKRLLQRPAWERRLRELWVEFRSLLPVATDWREYEAQLRYAFYLLFSLADGTAWWVHGACEDANGDDVQDLLSRAAVLSVGNASPFQLSGEARAIWEAAKHPGTGPVGAREALIVLTAGVAGIQAGSLGSGQACVWQGTNLNRRPEAPAGCRIDLKRLAGVAPPATGTDATPCPNLGHLQRSRLGAVQLAMGFLCGRQDVPEADLAYLFSEAPSDAITALTALRDTYPDVFRRRVVQGPPRVVLIDDQGDGSRAEQRSDCNGWRLALEMTCGEPVAWYPSLQRFLEANVLDKTNVVLLDLWLVEGPLAAPSPQVGLSALKTLKELDPGLPVIVLSAATDAVNAIRCLRRGALDYVPKWLPEEAGPPAWQRFTSGLLDRIAAARKLADGDHREIWQRIRTIRERLPRPTGDRECSAAMGTLGFWDQVRQEFYHYLLPAIILYHTHRVNTLLGGRIPPLDAWRVRGLLQTQSSLLRDAVLLAGRAVEFLGWAQYCERSGVSLTPLYWPVERAEWIRRASSHAGRVWEERLRVKDPLRPRPAGWRVDSSNVARVLRSALQALDDFENQ